ARDRAVSQVMNELDYTDALAAEYVLGTLDFEERMQARTLLDVDEAFAAKVQLWEHRFGELHLMVEPVEPEAAIWSRIKAKVPEARRCNHQSRKSRRRRSPRQRANHQASMRSKPRYRKRQQR